jgi:hypothetical protein
MQAQCPYCQAALTVHQKINPGHCGAPDCLHKHAVQADGLRQAALLEKYQSEVARAKTRFMPEIEAQAAAHGVPEERVFVGAVPHTDAALIPLPADRRAAYLAHLTKITEAAFAQEDLPPAQPSDRDARSEQGEPHPWNNAACATCQGHCCQTQGAKTHAFQTLEGMIHLRRTRPELNAEGMIAHFTDALPEVSNEDGCVFQGPKGCVLDRADRANTCNTFRCYALHQLAQNIDPETADAIALVSVDDRQAHRMNLVVKRTD